MTQQGLADAAQLHVNDIKRYESGTAQPPLDALVRLAKSLQLGLDDLVFDGHDRAPPDDLKLQFRSRQPVFGGGETDRARIARRTDSQARGTALECTYSSAQTQAGTGVNEARAVGATNTYGPLTTTSSLEELIMADANLNASRIHPERRATVQQPMRWHPVPTWSGQWKTPTFFPLLRIAGKWLIQVGFEPGQRVRVTVEHGRPIVTHD